MRKIKNIIKSLYAVLPFGNNRRGSVMFIVIMVLVTVSLIGALVMTATHFNSKLTSNEVLRKRAFYVAETGAMAAIESLNTNQFARGIIFNNRATTGGSFTVQVFDSTDFAWLPGSNRIVRSVGRSGKAVRRLEFRLVPSTLSFRDIPGPLYIEAPNPQFAGNAFTVQGADHHYKNSSYYIPTPPGIHREAVATIRDSASIINAIGSRGDQVFTVNPNMTVKYTSINPNHDTLDLQALADIYAGPNGQYADTVNYVIGMYPNNYKVSYFPGDCHVSGGGPGAGASGSEPCPNCRGTGVVQCWGCQGTGYELRGTSCATCKGAGKITCANCNGTGCYRCTTCNGTGGNPLPCDSCSGSGIYGCRECFGTGICQICRGTGISKDNKNQTWSCYRCGTGGKGDPPGTGRCITCNGTGGIACPFCGATGVKPGTGCLTCGGTGSLQCAPCGATGRRICVTCGGSGGTGARDCPLCPTAGYSVGAQKCPYCNGKGKKPKSGSAAGPSGTYGAGVMVVRGDLVISGQFEFVGLIIVLGDVKTDLVGGGQGVHIWGSILCRSVDFKIAGNADICWCADALRRLQPRSAGFQIASVIEY